VNLSVTSLKSVRFPKASETLLVEIRCGAYTIEFLFRIDVIGRTFSPAGTILILPAEGSGRMADFIRIYLKQRLLVKVEAMNFETTSF
jgi:hypothetical protein